MFEEDVKINHTYLKGNRCYIMVDIITIMMAEIYKLSKTNDDIQNTLEEYIECRFNFIIRNKNIDLRKAYLILRYKNAIIEFILKEEGFEWKNS